MKLREKIYRLIEPSVKFNTRDNLWYDIFIIAVILVSLMPMFFKGQTLLFRWIELFCGSILIVDYILRWVTADYRLGQGQRSFALHPVTPWAICDLIGLLPIFGLISPLFYLFRALRVLRIFSVLRVMRYSSSIRMIVNVLYNNRMVLGAMLGVAVVYIAMAALIVFNLEPDSFDDYFNAFYWATMTLTSIGYGDFVPLTIGGKLVAIVSSLLGLALIALPAGIVTAGVIKEFNSGDYTRAQRHLRNVRHTRREERRTGGEAPADTSEHQPKGGA